MRGPAPPAGSAVLRGPVGPAMSLETLLPGVNVPGLCQIVLTVGLLPGVAVPLPAVWDPLFALSPVEELKGTGAEVVGRSLAVRDGWSGPDVAGISAVVARVHAVLLNIGTPSDRAVRWTAWNDGCHREKVDDWTIYELTIYELMMVVVYMFCAYVLLCIFCSQGFSRFASLSWREIFILREGDTYFAGGRYLFRGRDLLFRGRDLLFHGREIIISREGDNYFVGGR